MTTRRGSWLSLFALAVLLTTSLPAASECEDLTEWLPDDVIAYAQLTDLGTNLRSLLGSKFLEDLRQSTAGKVVEAEAKFQEAMGRIQQFGQTVDRDPIELIDDLLGEEVVVGVRMNLFIPEVVVLTRAKSVAKLDAGRKALERAFEAQAGFLPTTEKTTFDGKTVEKLDKALFTYIGRVVVVSNSETMIQSVLKLASGESKRSVHASTVFERVTREQRDHTIVDVALRPRFVPNFNIPSEADNAVASLLFQGISGSLSASDLLTFSLGATPDGLRLSAKSYDRPQGLGESFEAFFPKTPRSGLRARLEEKGVIGCVELHRDFVRWWESSEKLLASRAQGDLVKFAQGASIFFGGLSFQDEVLPKIGERVLFVVSNQSYEGFSEVPEPAIPGLAVVLEIDGAEEFGRQFEVAFNSLVGIVNLDRMQKQKGGPTLLVRPVKMGSVDAYTVDMGLPESKDGKRPGIEYNFTPSLAVVGRHVALSSSEELLRTLVAAIEAEDKSAPESRGGRARDRIAIDARESAKALAANVDFLAAENMVKKGISLDQARLEIHAVLELVELLRDLRIATERGEDSTSMTIRLRLAERGEKTSTARVSVER